MRCPQVDCYLMVFYYLLLSKIIYFYGAVRTPGKLAIVTVFFVFILFLKLLGIYGFGEFDNLC